MKRAPLFLTFAETVEIHRYQIEHFGGEPGIRDVDLLRSALAMPSATFDGRFLHPTVEEMAAAYLFHLVENHPFVDGNKRTGTMAALVFLDLNGYEFEAKDEELIEAVMKTASGMKTKAELASFFRKHLRRRARRA